jgi:pimeloyl-ACP methyl ester carboxylesterase
MVIGGMMKTVFILLLSSIILTVSAQAQQQCIRIMKQDSSLNNLVDPPGYKTSELGTLGRFEKAGTGPQNLILIPGCGFGGGIFRDYMNAHKDQYTMYVVTLPGFDGTSAPPLPAVEVSYGDQTWTNGAMRAIEKLMETEKIENPIIVGHWMTGTQLALKLALNHKDKIKAVVLVAGVTTMVMTDTSVYPPHMPLKQRVAGIDMYMVPKWFKTVTRETWDDNNFLPQDYAVNPIMALRLWREAAEPPLHVWIRYLNEFSAQDITFELDSLSVPTLLIKPGLEGIYFDPGQNYLNSFCNISWNATIPKNKMIQAVTIPNSRTCIWLDQPTEFDRVVDEFLKGVQ